MSLSLQGSNLLAENLGGQCRSEKKSSIHDDIVESMLSKTEVLVKDGVLQRSRDSRCLYS